MQSGAGQKTWHPWPVNPVNECIFSPCLSPSRPLSPFFSCPSGGGHDGALTKVSHPAARAGRPCRRRADGALQGPLDLLALYLTPRAGYNCFLCGMAPTQNSTLWTIPSRNRQTTAHRINTLNLPTSANEFFYLAFLPMIHAADSPKWVKAPFSLINNKWRGSPLGIIYYMDGKPLCAGCLGW